MSPKQSTNTKSKPAPPKSVAKPGVKLRRTPEIYKSGIRVVVPDKTRADGEPSNRPKIIAMFLYKKDADNFVKSCGHDDVRIR